MKPIKVIEMNNIFFLLLILLSGNFNMDLVAKIYRSITTTK